MKLYTKAGWEGNYFVSSNYGLLLVDSGAAASQLPENADTAKLPVVRTAKSHGCLGAVVKNIVRADRITCGEMTGENLEVTLDERLHLLGNDVLGAYAYTFDLKRMELLPAEPFADGMPCILGKRHHLFTSVELNGKKGLAMIDTGCAVTTLDRGFLEAAAPGVQPYDTEQVTDSAGVTECVDKVRLAGFSIHGVSFPEQSFMVMNYGDLNKALEHSIVATVGASSMEIRKFSLNQRDGFLRIEDYE